MRVQWAFEMMPEEHKSIKLKLYIVSTIYFSFIYI